MSIVVVVAWLFEAVEPIADLPGSSQILCVSCLHAERMGRQVQGDGWPRPLAISVSWG